MILAIYRKDGEITHIVELKDVQDLAQKVEEYNQRNNPDGHSAEIEECADDSPVAFLYNSRELKKRDFRDTLRGIECAINELDSDLSWLRSELEDME